MSDEWDWEFTDTADRQFDGLDEYAQDRISSKLDEIVADQWRTPMDYLEPLEGAPHQNSESARFASGVVLLGVNRSSTCLRSPSAVATPTAATTDRPRFSSATIHMH